MEDDIIRVAILAPTVAVRVGLRTILRHENQFDIIIEVSNFGDLENYYPDIDLIILQGDSLLEEWRPNNELISQIALFWVTDAKNAAEILWNLPIQAWGIASLESTEDELLAAVLTTSQGFIVAQKQRLEPFWINQVPRFLESHTEQLTPRESEVLQFVAHGLSNKQIAIGLDISEHTVKFHISSIYSKLRASNRTEAVRIGLQLGIISI